MVNNYCERAKLNVAIETNPKVTSVKSVHCFSYNLHKCKPYGDDCVIETRQNNELSRLEKEVKLLKTDL
jgi:hypothetical protein